MRDTYLTRPQAAETLGVSPATLAKWAVAGGGPPMVRLSARCVRYRRSDLDEWADKRTVRSTADPGRESRQAAG